MLHAAAFGTPEDAWEFYAGISAETESPTLTARTDPCSMMPTKYEDIWTAAKVFSKLEPIVADGGELIIYAPHITQVGPSTRSRSPRLVATPKVAPTTNANAPPARRNEKPSAA